MLVPATPSKRRILSTLIAQGNATPIKNFAKKYKIPKSAVKEGNAAFEYGVMALEPLSVLNKRQEVVNLLEKTQPLATQFALKFGIGGKRKRSKTRKVKIPPALAEEAIEVLAEVAVGGKRRKTRRNK